MKNIQTKPTRLWFLAQGCQLVPHEQADGYIRWGHPDGYFLKPDGTKATDNYSPASQGANPNTQGGDYPQLRECRKKCHILMALAFYGPRPIDPETGKHCVCHHLIKDRRNYRPANLIAWLTKSQHQEADRRQRLLIKTLPDGNLYALPYARLRELQDPRILSDAAFTSELEAIQARFAEMDKVNPQDIIDREMNRHMEY